MAYTLQVGRRVFNHRRLVVAKDIEDTIAALDSPERVLTQDRETKNRPVVFMFTGQGSQYVNMARELYEAESVFQQECDRCCELLQPYLGLDLRSLLYPKADLEQAAQQLQQTAIAQPAIFVIEYALAKLWMSWGIKPVAAIGHSIGEYVAATIAGVFSLEDALALVTARGQLMQQLPSGSMLAIPLSSAEIQPLLNENLSLAVINGISNCVVSGANEAITTLQDCLVTEGIDCRRLHTSHAFHSAMIEPILEPFRDRVSQVKLNPPQIPYISNVTGTWITAEDATNPDYWTTHLRQTVRFAEGLQELFKQPDKFVWTSHFINMDGWSVALVLSEFMQLYAAFCQNRKTTLTSGSAFKNYITWLQKQDFDEAETFWREKLKGLKAPTPLTNLYLNQSFNKEQKYDQQRRFLSETTTTALKSLARQHQLTLNTLIQATWALLLSRYTGQKK